MKKKILTLTIIAFGLLYNGSAFAITESWWSKYGDKVLVDNLYQLYDGNKDLKIAAYKTKQMQEVVKMSVANQLPQLGFSGNIGHEFTSSDMYFGDMLIPDYHQTNFMLPFQLTYEADIWGRNFLATKAVKQVQKMTLQDEELVKVIIESNFASAYFNLIKVDELLKNQKILVDLQSKIVEMTEKKYENGLAVKADILREKQALSAFNIQLNNLLQKQEFLQNQMIVMLGSREKSKIERSSADTLKMISMPKEVNAEVIADRPDYIKSELYVKKVGYDVRVAKRDFLPKFILYGTVGFNAYANSMAQKTFLSNIGVLPQWDIFAGGRKLAHFRYTKTEAKKAVEMYEKTVLTSMQEINDALVKIKTANKDYLESVKNNEMETEKYQLTTKKYNAGGTSYYEKLCEERNTYLAKNKTIASKIDYLISTVDLYKALGGKNTENL